MKKIVLFVLLTISLFGEMIGSFDKDFLISYATNHPKDIKSRELLLLHFYKKNDKKMILKYSQELFSLNPKDEVLNKVVQTVYQKDIDKKIVLTLKFLYQNKSYTKYLNFYQALLDTKKKLPSVFHVDALYCAVEISDFRLAKKILRRKDLPMSPHLSEVMKVLDKKLGSKQSL